MGKNINRDLHKLPNWLYVPTLEKMITRAEDLDDFLEKNQIFMSVLDSIHEGVSILSRDRKVLYLNDAMNEWYDEKSDTYLGCACHHIFHNADSPCENCPAITAIASMSPCDGMVTYHSPERPKGQVYLHCTPILNEKGEISLIMEYVNNVSFASNSEAQIDQLTAKLQLLEKQNKLLITTVTEKEKEYYDLQTKIRSNFENYIRPAFNFLSKDISRSDYKLVNDIIDHALLSITENNQDNIFSALTARELQVAKEIKSGKTSKEIADDLFITKKAVDFHRTNIRKKLGLDPKANLKVYLEMHLP